jgi:hypothetical protein
MRELLGFELYKIFQQKMIYFLALFLFGLLTIGILIDAFPENVNHVPYEGTISEEFISSVKGSDNNNSFGESSNHSDLKIPSSIYYRMEESVKIHQSINDRINSIEKDISKTKNENRDSVLERSLLLKIGSPVYYYDEGLTWLILKSSVITMSIGSLLTLGLAGIFSLENTTGVNQIILSSKKGRKQIVTAKIVASLIFTALVCLSLNLYSLFLIKFVYGSLGWDSLLQYLPLFHQSPYPFTLGQYYLIQFGIQLVSGISFSFFILLISALSKHSMISFFISGFVFINFVWIDFDAQSVVAQKILNFTYYGLMKVNGLFKEFETINLFGYPLLYPLAAIVVIIILSVITIKILYTYNQRKEIA